MNDEIRRIQQNPESTEMGFTVIAVHKRVCVKYIYHCTDY